MRHESERDGDRPADRRPAARAGGPRTRSTQSIRVAVTGLAATYPFGGVFWDYMQYVLGLHRLGHDVLYIEDNGRWCYDPGGRTFVGDAAENVAGLARAVRAVEPELADRWFYRDSAGRTYGRSWADVKRFVREADLFVHVSASCWMRDEYFAARRTAFVDSDPMYTQASVPAYLDGTASAAERERVDMLRRHDVMFTFAENVGGADCDIPRGVFDWVRTRQPIVLDCFRPFAVPAAERRPVFTTVASWEPTEKGPVVGGVAYTGKSTELRRFIDLPRRVDAPLEIALSGPAPYAELRDRGWRVIDAFGVSGDPWAYRDYLARSLGEWSVAKNAYAASRSGWFSCRSACYLALGVPAIVQDTGFTTAIPAGEGLLAFRTEAEAAAAIADVAADPARHSAAASELAREYFDSDRVLTGLIEKAMAARVAPTAEAAPTGVPAVVTTEGGAP